MKNIIIPTDFSPCATNALQYAIGLALKLESKLHVIYVYDTEVMMQAIAEGGNYINVPMPIPDIDFKKMEEVEKELSNYPGLAFECFIKIGFLDEMLIEMAEKKRAGLIIMGTNGAHDQLELWTGTNTSRMVERKKMPVISVPNGYVGKLKEHSEFVLATDFETINDWSVMDSFYDLALKLNAKINVFYVKNHSEAADKKAYELGVYADLVVFFKGVDLTMHHSSKDHIVTAIEDFAKIKNADLVMMVTHERGWLEDLFSKSITKDMTLHSNVPFMTIPDHHVAEFNKSYNANYW